MTAAEQDRYQKMPTDESEAQTLASADLDYMKSEWEAPCAPGAALVASLCWASGAGTVGQAEPVQWGWGWWVWDSGAGSARLPCGCSQAGLGAGTDRAPSAGHNHRGLVPSAGAGPSPCGVWPGAEPGAAGASDGSSSGGGSPGHSLAPGIRSPGLSGWRAMLLLWSSQGSAARAEPMCQWARMGLGTWGAGDPSARSHLDSCLALLVVTK